MFQLSYSIIGCSCKKYQCYKKVFRQFTDDVFSCILRLGSTVKVPITLSVVRMRKQGIQTNGKSHEWNEIKKRIL